MKIDSFINPLKSSTRAALIIAAVCAAVAGCASKNVNPVHARNDSGYVDLFTDETDLYWKVDQVDNHGKAKTVFEKFAPLDERVLRLQFPPGQHRLHVTFLNRVITKPAEVDVQVQNGQVTPVHVTFADASVATVFSKHTSVGGTAHGRYGRRTTIDGNETTMYNIVAEAGLPVAFQPRDQMTYASQ